MIALWTEGYVTEGEGGRTAPYAESEFFDTAAWRTRPRRRSRRRDRRRRRPASPRALPRARWPGQGRLSSPGSAVAASARRRGIGRALLLRCAEVARAEGWQAMALWSRAYQTAAHRLYESAGYRRMPERDDVDASGHARRVFRLSLDPLREWRRGEPHAAPRGIDRHARAARRGARRGALGGGAGAGDLGLARQPATSASASTLWLELTLEAARAGREGPFTTRDARREPRSAAAATSTSAPHDRVVEIGWTWLNPSAWRSGANVEAKLLMMRHAFETPRLRAGRVQDRRPQRALARGARRAAGPVRGDHAQPHDRPRRRPARLRLLQRDRLRVARGSRQPASAAWSDERRGLAESGNRTGPRAALRGDRGRSSTRSSRSGTRCRPTTPRSRRSSARGRRSARSPMPGASGAPSTSAGWRTPTPSSSSPRPRASRSATPSSPSARATRPGRPASASPSSRHSPSSPTIAAAASAPPSSMRSGPASRPSASRTWRSRRRRPTSTRSASTSATAFASASSSTTAKRPAEAEQTPRSGDVSRRRAQRVVDEGAEQLAGLGRGRLGASRSAR